jgi:hypothetical protein
MQINFSTFIALACAVLAISALPQNAMPQKALNDVVKEAGHLKWTNGQLAKEHASLKKERGELAMHTKQAKQLDNRADNIYATIVQGQKNGMSKDAIAVLEKSRSSLRAQEKKKLGQVASDRKSINKDKADVKRLNGWKSFREGNIQNAAARI